MKLINAQMTQNIFKPSILLRTTLNTWRLTPHVSRWYIEKVLEIALSLIPLYPKPQIPAVEIESSSRFQSSPNGIDPASRRPGPLHGVFARQGQGMQNHQPWKLLRGPSLQGSAGDGKMDGKGGPGVGTLWKLGRLSKTFKSNIEYRGTPGIWKLWWFFVVIYIILYTIWLFII